MRISVKRISKTKGVPDWGPAIVKEVHQQLTADNTTLRLAKKIVADWDNKPGFGAQVIKRGGSLISTLVALGKNAKIWYWVSLGTKGPYPIVAKNAPFLVFRKGYKPRTTPKGRTATFGGPGVATGSLVSKKAVMHPGIKARDFETLIRSQYTKTFRAIIRQAVKDGAAKARKGLKIEYSPSRHSRRKRG